MNFASFKHFLQFSEKQRKGKTLYTKPELATGADTRDQDADAAAYTAEGGPGWVQEPRGSSAIAADGWGPRPWWRQRWQSVRARTKHVRQKDAARGGGGDHAGVTRAGVAEASRMRAGARRMRLDDTDQEEVAPPTGGRRSNAGDVDMRRRSRHQRHEKEPEGKERG